MSLKNNPIALKIFATFAVLAAVYGGYRLLVSTEFIHPIWQNPKTYTIDMTKGGFSPSKINIKVGDTVEFKNKKDIGAWPASDPHPTHYFFSSFDPRAPVSPEGTWSYTFTKPGNWRFHDHLNPLAQGEIIVLENNKSVDKKTVFDGSCEGQCFDDLIRDIVKKDGIEASYRLFQEVYSAGKLPRSCHWTAHEIGEAAYELFKEGRDFPISKETSYCGYGFYHGFMESLLRENPDPVYALSFCDKVEKSLGNMGLQNCYHGIGHGYTEDPPDPATEGNFDAMVKPGIKMCEFLFGKNFRNLNLCLTGVFTVPAGFAAKGEYGLTMDPKDPFAFCKKEPYRYQKACYGEFAPKLDEMLDWDMYKLPAYINEIGDNKLKRLVTWVVPSVFMAHDILKNDQSNYITGCRDNFTGRYRLICWGGTILGFFAHGNPEKQYEKVINFCASKSWENDDERTFCYGEGLRQMRQNYPLTKVKEICGLVPDKYRSLCLDTENKHMSPYDDPVFD